MTAQRIFDDLPVVDAATASEHVSDCATVLVSGFGSVGYPKAVPLALAGSSRELGLTVISGGSVGKEIDVELVEADAIERRLPYQSRRPARNAINDGEIAYQDRNISSFGDEILYGDIDPDVAIVEAVAAGDSWFIPSTSIGHTTEFVEAAKQLIIEVNTALPRSLERYHDVYRLGPPPIRGAIPMATPNQRIGGSRIEFDPESLLAVVKTDHADEPYSFRSSTETDLAIAENLFQFLSETVARSVVFDQSVQLQFGVGSLGNALMRELGKVDFGERDVHYFGEVIQDGLLDLLVEGRLASASATSLALSERGQRRLFENVDRYSEWITLRPAAISNDPGLIARFGVISVNSALEVDIYGNANSTHVNGRTILNGIGGSGDFVQNSPLSVIALPAALNDVGTTRIVPMVSHVDHTEHNVDVIVTEYGVADLRWKSPRERARSIIGNCAHPVFRDELMRYFENALASGGHTPHDLSVAHRWRENEQED